MDDKNHAGQRARYRWPWIVLGAVIVAVALAILWMTVLVRRLQSQREFMAWPAPASQTNAVPQTNSIPQTNNVSRPAKQ